MATSVNNENNYKCPLCGDFYVEPKLLPCAHRVCRDCLYDKTRTTKCPICVVPIFSCGDQTDTPNVDSLPTDICFEAIVKSAKILNKQSCDNCQNNNAAVSVCYDCDIKMCAGCLKAHGASERRRNHPVERLSKTTPEKHARSQHVFCKVHNDMKCEMYCGVHNTPICYKCAFENHHGCRKDIKTLENKVLESKKALDELEQDLNSAGENLNLAIKKLDNDIKQTESDAKDSFADIDHKLDSLKKAVDDCIRRLKTQAQTAFSHHRKKKEGEKQTLSQRYSILKSNLDVITQAKENVLKEAPDAVRLMLLKQIQSLNVGTALDNNDEDVPVTRVSIDTARVQHVVHSIDELGTEPRLRTKDAFTQTDQNERYFSTQTPVLVFVDSLVPFCFQGVCTKLDPCTGAFKENTTQAQQNGQNTNIKSKITETQSQRERSRQTADESELQAASRNTNVSQGTRPSIGTRTTDVPVSSSSVLDHSKPVSLSRTQQERTTELKMTYRREDSEEIRPKVPNTDYLSPRCLNADVQDTGHTNCNARRLTQSCVCSSYNFAKMAGSSVVLSEDRRTATFHGKARGGGLVLAEGPMRNLWLYQVKLDMVPCGPCNMSVGVILTDQVDSLVIPAGVTFWGHAVTVSSTPVCTSDCTTKSLVGKALGSLKKEDTVGVLMDHGGCLHLFVNGVDQGIAAQDLLNKTCFAFFELAFHNGCNKISTQPIYLYKEADR